MNRTLRLIMGVLAGIAVTSAPIGARAGELNLTGNFSTLTSPENNIGPWRTLLLSDREIIGADKPGLTLIDRTDADAGGPTHGQGIAIDDYHDWSPRFFTYVAVGFASGNLLPNRNAYLEGDLKFGHSLATVFGAGAGVVANPDGTTQRYLNAGPTWYFGDSNLTLRVLPSFTSGRMGAASGIITYANGMVGKTVGTLTLLGGSEPPYGVVTQSATFETGERVLYAGVDVKHWLSPKGGFHAGLEIEQLTDRASGNLLYVRRGITLGVFRQIGPGSAP